MLEKSIRSYMYIVLKLLLDMIGFMIIKSTNFYIKYKNYMENVLKSN